LENVPCKRRKHSSIDFDRKLFAITKGNNISKLQSFLENDHFGSKIEKKFTIEC
jgi:hypothetical protein